MIWRQHTCVTNYVDQQHCDWSQATITFCLIINVSGRSTHSLNYLRASKTVELLSGSRGLCGPIVYRYCWFHCTIDVVNKVNNPYLNPVNFQAWMYCSCRQQPVYHSRIHKVEHLKDCLIEEWRRFLSRRTRRTSLTKSSRIPYLVEEFVRERWKNDILNTNCRSNCMLLVIDVHIENISVAVPF